MMMMMMMMEDEPPPIVRIDRQSSIENEPRTLGIRQMRFARDEALYVINTRNYEDAVRIFTEGLEPVVSVAEQNGRDAICMDEEFECSMTMNELRDVSTAPF
ncbi:uncharacterized protein LOC130781741 [Actinidia eriantha]|uniref:uncharacterized protein LOC130781741 n=1 Tax=Actinidia eriantha TaxID=165200 RepID=UPI00258C163C|nr:uncharacterized protein LOC130781741 [Actinidia eriantha]